MSMRTINTLVLIVGVLTLTSCLKDDDTGYTEDNVAAAQFLNAIPGSDGLIVALDNNQLNNMSYLEYFASGDVLPYRRVFPGNRVFRAFLPENVNSNIELKRKDMQFTPGKFYSVFLAGVSEEDFEIFHVEDSVQAPVEGKAYLRFIHLEAEGETLDFGVEGSATPLAGNVNYKSFSDFMEIDGDEDYTFYVRNADGSGETHSFTVEIENKDIYTVWVNGPLSHGVIKH